MHPFKMKLNIVPLLFTARVVTDRASGYSKGFGFVRYATLDEAAAGIKGMDGQVSYHSRNICRYKHKRSDLIA